MSHIPGRCNGLLISMRNPMVHKLIIVFSLIILVLHSCKRHPHPVSEHESMAHVSRARTSPYQQGLFFADQQQYDSALLYFGLAYSHSLSAGDTLQAMRAMVKSADMHRGLGQIDLADSLLRQAEGEVFGNSRFSIALGADVLHAQGALSRMCGDDGAAMALYRQSLEWREKHSGPMDTLMIPTLNNLGNLYTAMATPDTAFMMYKRAAALQNLKMVPDRADGLVCQNLGLALDHQGEYLEADRWYEKAMSIFQKVLNRDDLQLASLQNAFASSLIQRGDHQEALKYLLRAEKIFAMKPRRDVTLLFQIRHNAGIAYFQNTDHHRAQYYLVSALNVMKNLSAEFTGDREKVVMSLAKVYQELGEIGKALLILDTLTEERHSPQVRADALLLSAKIYSESDNPQEAFRQYRLATSLLRNNKTISKLQCVGALNSYGAALLQFGHIEEAGKQHLEALRFGVISRGNPAFDKGVTQAYLARVYIHKKQYQKALHQISLALEYNQIAWGGSVRMLGSDSLARVYNAYNQAVFFAEKAMILYKLSADGTGLSCKQEALQDLQKSLAYLRKVEQQMLDRDEDRISLFENIDPFGLALEIVWSIGDQGTDIAQDVFRLMEASRSNALKNQVKAAAGIRGNSKDDSQLTRRRVFHQAIYRYEQLARAESERKNPDFGKIHRWDSLSSACLLEYDSLSELIQMRTNRSSDVVFQEENLSAGEVQKKLPPGTCLIEYTMVGDSTLFIAGITADAKLAFRVHTDTSFLAALLKFRGLLAWPDFSTHTCEDLSRFQDLSHFLYQVLLSPVLSRVTATKLIIMPDGWIGQIPFETLTVKKKPGLNSYRSPDYLIRHYSISYMYSYALRTEVNLFTGRFRMAAFAPEMYPEEKGWDIRDRMDGERGLLPGSGEEIRALQKEIQGLRVYAGNQASEENFIANTTGNQVLHLALHASIDEKNPAYSRLYFHGPNKALKDDALHAYEIFGMPVQARMVVLSACNSGHGSVCGREGALSLTRAFLGAGVPTVVMSHWDLDDFAASGLVSNLYKELTQNHSVDDALRQAKLHFLDNTDNLRAHPYFWASLLVYGNTQPLGYHKHGDKYYLCAGIFLGIMMLYLLYTRKKLARVFHRRELKAKFFKQ